MYVIFYLLNCQMFLSILYGDAKFSISIINYFKLYIKNIHQLIYHLFDFRKFVRSC